MKCWPNPSFGCPGRNRADLDDEAESPERNGGGYAGVYRRHHRLKPLHRAHPTLLRQGGGHQWDQDREGRSISLLPLHSRCLLKCGLPCFYLKNYAHLVHKLTLFLPFLYFYPKILPNCDILLTNFSIFFGFRNWLPLISSR